MDGRRVVDIAVSASVLALAAPVMAVVGLAIKAEMGGPVIFRQRRTGLRGKEFEILKFKSMRDPAYEGEPDSARTSKLGHLLRNASLDELPQLVNVLRGEMSLIGPRPTLPSQVCHYTTKQRGRLEVKPGITGWAQVTGRNSIDWPQRIERDVWYINHRHWSLDAKIVAMTVARLIRPTDITHSSGENQGFPTPAQLHRESNPSTGQICIEPKVHPFSGEDDMTVRTVGRRASRADHVKQDLVSTGQIPQIYPRSE